MAEIVLIVGGTGAGKSSCLSHIACDFLTSDREYDLCLDKIKLYNLMGYNLSTPKHLVFSDFKISSNTKLGYIESYFVNGFYLGMPNAQHPTMFLPPYAKVFLSEGQRYYDSRKYSSFSDFISQFYEQHRHYGLSIYIDCQRPGLIDLNIREIATKVYYIESMVNDIDRLGRIVANHWKVRKFDSVFECEKYIQGDKTLGTPMVLTHSHSITNFVDPIFLDSPKFTNSNFNKISKGNKTLIPCNIFNNYNSTNKELAFLRGRKGHDFSLYKHPTDDMYINELDDIYSFEAPRTFYKLSSKELKEIRKGSVLTI